MYLTQTFDEKRKGKKKGRLELLLLQCQAFDGNLSTTATI